MIPTLTKATILSTMTTTTPTPRPHVPFPFLRPPLRLATLTRFLTPLPLERISENLIPTPSLQKVQIRTIEVITRRRVQSPLPRLLRMPMTRRRPQPKPHILRRPPMYNENQWHRLPLARRQFQRRRVRSQCSCNHRLALLSLELRSWTLIIRCVAFMLAIESPPHCTLCLKVGPRIEFSKGAVFEDEEIAKIMPFLALPDGAHLVRQYLTRRWPLLTPFQSVEDYSYFHLVPSSPNPTTIFGISCVFFLFLFHASTPQGRPTLRASAGRNGQLKRGQSQSCLPCLPIHA